MTVTIFPGVPLTGTLDAIASKSAAHRLMICAALADGPTTITCPQRSQDIDATLRCLTGLGASFQPQGKGYLVTPAAQENRADHRLLDCGESGSTLRFLLPVAGALGANATFQLAGRLAQRPMAPLLEQLEAHGCQTYLDQKKKTLSISGQLTPGAYRLPGDVSSQFFTGLLFALPLLGEESILEIEGELESASYLQLTIQALAAFGVTPERMETGWIVRPQAYRTPGRAIVEGDWSNAAPWLCMGAMDGDSVTVKGLDPDSQQGDRAVCRVLGEMGVPIHHTADRYTSHPGRLHPTTIDARDIPDLVPVLAALAASIPGTTIITGAARLRLKESDRLATTAATLNALGGQVAVTDDGLILQGKAHLLGGTVDAAGDHRIAMAAAVAACACSEPVVITGAQAVEKSYPTFWHELRALGKPVEEAP